MRGPCTTRGLGRFSSASVVFVEYIFRQVLTATGPGVPSSARWKVRAIASEACSGSLTSITVLVISD